MFSTSLATAAVAGLLASGSLAHQPAWQSDYRKALAQAAEQQKPVAVFIARGGAGYARLGRPFPPLPDEPVLEAKAPRRAGEW